MNKTLECKVISSGVILENYLIAGNCIVGDKIFISANSGGDLSPGQSTSVFVTSTKNISGDVSKLKEFESVFSRGGTESGSTITASGDRIFIPYSDGFYLNSEKNLERRSLVFCPVSDDSGKTWDCQRALEVASVEAFAFGRVVKYENELILPVWGSVMPGDKWESGTLSSLDNGNSWGNYRRIAFHCNETAVIHTGTEWIALIRGLGISYDGFVEVSVRSEHEKRGLFISKSEDCTNWTEPGFSGIYGTSPSLCRLSNGSILAGCRSVEKGGLCRIALYSEGNFQFVCDLKTPSGYWKYGGYPVISQMDDGNLFVTFHCMLDDVWVVGFNIIQVLN
ncbi:glycoside hydrolase [Myxococcota bacterium]|nr:glycoside hydrolase [Myxococcota bacterium]MBU1380467.1 glycoside hydrolase [Myxococcota bacterium]MBU1497536.1 glycoside hydrolase [Myxococcota bacterium]